MKTITTVLVLSAGLALPMSAMADDTAEVTIRVMEMSETQAQEVIRNIELPDAASASAEDGLENAEQHRNQIRAQERERLMDEMDAEQDRDMLQEQDMIREQLRDSMDVPEMPGGGIQGN